MTDRLLGVAEIATMLGLSRQRVNQLVQSDDFPAPEAELSAGRIWARPAVEAWVAAHPVRATEAGGQAIFGRFSPEARTVVVRAQEEARTLRHGFIGTEHVLLALLSAAPGIRQRLATLGVERTPVTTAVTEQSPSGDTAPAGHIPFTPLAKLLLEASATAAGDRVPIEPRHIALALVSVADGLAAELLRQASGLDQDGLVDAVSRLLADPELDVPLSPAPVDDALLRCSFCGKDQTAVRKLIAGPDVYICNECVDLCDRILADEAGTDRSRLTDRLDALAAELDQLRRDIAGSA